MVYIQGLEVVPFARATSKDDRATFSTMVWARAKPCVEAAYEVDPQLPDQLRLLLLLDKVAAFYLGELEQKMPLHHLSRHQGPMRRLFGAVPGSRVSIQDPELTLGWKEMLNGTESNITTALEPFAGVVDVKLLSEIGLSLAYADKRSLPDITTNTKKRDELLSQWYTDGLGVATSIRVLAQTVKQIIHRYPNMHILEVSGSAKTATTKAILREIGSTFASYTFTSASSILLDEAQEEFHESSERIMFQSFDMTKTPNLQGFSKSYDLVVVTLAFHGIICGGESLHNVRKLLKPGGHLIIMDFREIYGPFLHLVLAASEWLSGNEESLVLPMSEWDSLLRESGFSGIDSSTPEHESSMPFCVLASQAVDDRVSFLRDPLSQICPGALAAPPIEELLIVGGATLLTSRLCEQITILLDAQCASIRSLNSLIDLLSGTIGTNTVVLCIADLGPSVFGENTTMDQWDAIKKMVVQAKTVVWVSQGRRQNDPYARMMAGLMRSAKWDQPDLDHLLLDVEDPRGIDARMISEALVRHVVGTQWRYRNEISLSIESELVLQEGGYWEIPRLMLNEEMNKRYNSSRRQILDATRIGKPLEVVRSEIGWEIREQMIPHDRFSARQDGGQQLSATHSLLSAIRVHEFGCLFVVIGQKSHSADTFLILSAKQSSVVYPHGNLTVPVKVDADQRARLLRLVADYLLTYFILDGLYDGSRLILYDPAPELVSVLAEEAKVARIRLSCTTTQHNSYTDANVDWLVLNEVVSDRDVSRILEGGVTAFVNMAAQGTSGFALGEQICSALPKGCRKIGLDFLMGDESSEPHSSHLESIRKRLMRAVSRASSLAPGGVLERRHSTYPVVPVSGLSDPDLISAPLSVVDWSTRNLISVSIQSVDYQIYFSSGKTYWLVGLSGGIGLSLCEWMARRGARQFVISSRNPDIDPEWIIEMRIRGVVIKTAACDITKKQEVIKLYEDICMSMPPVAGIAQGAMILHDIAIKDMTLEQLLRVTKPKVEGSMHLNKLFQSDTLDFFIFFSSTVSVVGNYGQANYSAANAFMLGLAEQRRKRGLAASVIHMGPIIGIGYATRATNRNLFDKALMKRWAYAPTSEHDLHQIFAEAVLARRPGSGREIEILSGLRSVSSTDEAQPKWISNSIMSHLTVSFERLDRVANTAGLPSSLQVKEQLLQAECPHDVHEIIKNAFLREIASLFQLDIHQIDQTEPGSLYFNRMGVDSLSAGEIRSWFARNLEINIPILRILNGGSVGELVSTAIETLPARLVPKMGQSSSPFTNQSTLDNAATRQGVLAGSREAMSPTLYSKSNPPQNLMFISATNNKEAYRLSVTQAEYWSIWTFIEDKTALNHTGVIQMTGKIDTVRLTQAVRTIARQHKMLRTGFSMVDDVPMQSVLDQSPLKLEVSTLATDEDVQAYAKAVHNHIYDVATGDTMRLVFLSRSPTDHYLVFGLHPLAIDGISFQIFMKWLFHHYTLPNASPPKVAQFSSFSERQHADLAAGKYREQVNYWRQVYTTMVPPLPIMTLSSITSRPVINTYADVRTRMRIEKETKRSISDVCRRVRATPFHFYMAAFRALLLRYTVDGEDISIGMTDSNRKDEDMMECIGPFRNILPLRLYAQASDRFEDLLVSTRDKAYLALQNSSLPFSVLLSELDIPQAKTHSPLFQCSLDYRLGQREKTAWGANSLHYISFETEKSPYDIFMEIVDDPNGDCLVYLVARKDLYKQVDVERLAKIFEHLVKCFAICSDARIDEPSVVEPDEAEQVMRYSQGPICVSTWPETVVHRVDQVMRSNPDSPALRHGNGESTSYTQLVDYSLAVAAALLSLDIGPGCIVAVLQERTPKWIASIMGIMRCGAAYVPLELNMPWNRLAATVQDCHPQVLLVDDDTETNTGRLELLPEVTVFNVWKLGISEGTVPITATEHDIAAILYTSGSTGKPKGVILTHENVRNWVETVPPLTTSQADSGEVVLGQVASSFDMCISQIFTAICHGWTLYIVSRSDCKNSRAITDIMAREGITLTCATPSEYIVWFNFGRQGLLRCRTWRSAMTIGEPAPPSLPAKFASLGHKDLRYFNMYGPAESSFTCCFMHVPYEAGQVLHPSSRSLAAGYTQPNYTMYVLDAKLRVVPVGVQGEIYIGGAGIANGYLGMPDPTAEKFVPLPTALCRAQDQKMGWDKLHRSGDLGRWREDGAILIEARTAGDTQIKVQGVRVGLLEMELAILEAANGDISEAAVSVRPPGSDILVAHVVFKKNDDGEQEDELGKDQSTNIHTIEARLAKTLPLYMRLAAIIPVDSLPRTVNGKIDRKAIQQLPVPEGSEDDPEAMRGLTPTEARLKGVWQEVIAGSNSNFRRTITPRTDFFHVGGTSMLLLGLRARIQEVFDFNLRLMGMFENSSLEAMAKVIDSDAVSKQSKQGAQIIASDIDWDQETALSESLLTTTQGQLLSFPDSAENGQRSRVVVLTGSTGLLGRGLLDALLTEKSIKHVHCIGVRNAKYRHDLPKVDGARVSFHSGDLASPRIGLAEDDADRIFSESDVIIHNGADMSHGRTYMSLRSCNVQATKELTMLGAPRRLAFHYISSLGVGRVVAAARRAKVAKNSKRDEDGIHEDFVFGPVSASKYSPTSFAAATNSAAGSGVGLALSKWASERYLERLHMRYSNLDPPWPIWIHRPGQFVPAENTSQAHGLRLASNIRHYAKELRAVPVLEPGRMSGALEFAPLDVVVHGIVDAVLTSLGREREDKTDSLRFSHHLSNDRLVLSELQVMLEDGIDQVEEIDMATWARMAGNKGMHPTIVALLEDFAKEGTLIYPRLSTQ